MFDNRSEPLHLQSRLEAFIEHWHGDRRPWYGIDPEKLSQTRLPQPLRWLYGFAGEWAGRTYWETLLGSQDHLVTFEGLSLVDGKLVFAYENQGVWRVATEPEGEDPPVWVSFEDGPWRELEESLSVFLVTFVLHETVFSCTHRESADGMLDRLRVAGMQVVPLWLKAAYPGFDYDSPRRLLSFHAANEKTLVMDDSRCGTNMERPREVLPDVFDRDDQQTESTALDPYAAIPNHLEVPSFVRRSHLEQAITRHEEGMEFHRSRIEVLRKMAAEIDREAGS